MRVRAQDINGDYTFGSGSNNFLANSPEAVRQSVQTRLGLLQGEWFLDKTEGTPWMQEIIGKGTNKTYDLAIQTRILQTKGVKSIDQYQSSVDPVTRKLSVAALLDTIYGKIQL
jgi:hypothetical protein